MQLYGKFNLMSDCEAFYVCMQFVGLKLKEKYSCVLYPWFILVNLFFPLFFFSLQFHDKIILQNGLGFWQVWKPQPGMNFSLKFLFSVHIANSFAGLLCSSFHWYAYEPLWWSLNIYQHKLSRCNSRTFPSMSFTYRRKLGIIYWYISSVSVSNR